MKISVCIPNYNYENYLGRTIRSVLDQTGDGFELEIVIADNASTDGSMRVVHSFADARIKTRVNRCNVGFARNLDKAAEMATGDVMIMLSSDDLIRPGTLATYAKIFASLDPAARETTVVTAIADTIDATDAKIGSIPPDPELWRDSERLAADDWPALGGAGFRITGKELLRRCLRTRKNPFNFLATAYPRALYEAVEGYGGGRMINPDKWFHWRLLERAETAVFVDRPLFAYRWHGANQSAQQAATGALKFLADEYANTLEVDGATLERLGLSRADLEAGFIERVIARHGLATLATVGRKKANRIRQFGMAAYPHHAWRNKKLWALWGLLCLGPLGAAIARMAYRPSTAHTGTH